MVRKFTGTGTTSLNNATVPQYQLLSPFPEFGAGTEQYSSIGSAPYNSLQSQVRPMKNYFSIQGNFTWQKIMLRNGFFNDSNQSTSPPGTTPQVINPNLYSVQDPNAMFIANIFGTVQLPRL